MRKAYHSLGVLSTADLGLSLEELRGQTFDGFARMGAKLILKVALAEEVSDFLGRGRYERHGREGYRNGRRLRKVQIGSGTLDVAVPKVTGAVWPFHSEVLPAFKRRSAELDKVLPLLYAEGLSTRDFQRALGDLWGQAGLSRSSISRANQALHEAFSAWRKRDLSREEVVYLFLDGVYLKMRLGDSAAEAVLVAHGITKGGQRVLLGLLLGGRESEESWKALLSNLEERGLKPPSLAITDGNQGVIKALKSVWSEVPRQRCIAHKIRNVLERVPKNRWAEVKRELTRIFYAADLDAALATVKKFAAKFGATLPAACGVLAKNLADCLTFHRYPQFHWRRLRTANVIERAFREVRRRTNVVGRFPNEASALALIWATFEEDRLKWSASRRIEMGESLHSQALKAREAAKLHKLDLSFLDCYLEAA